MMHASKFSWVRAAPTTVCVRVRAQSAKRSASSYDHVDYKKDDVKAYGEWGSDGIRQGAFPSEDWEDGARALWLSNGATEVKAHRLIILGSKHRRDRIGEVFRDVEVIARMCENAFRLLDGARAHAICHRRPEAGLVLCSAATLSSAVVRVRLALPIEGALDMAKVVERAPELLDADEDALRRAGETTKILASALDIEMNDDRLREILETAPMILLADAADVTAALEQLLPLSKNFVSFANFVVDNAEAVIDSYCRSTLAQTMSMRKSYRV
jgi:hypothetical protein